MQKPHFFLAKSNLGVKKLWHGVECDLAAMKNAPCDFLTSEIVAEYPGSEVTEFEFTDSRSLQKQSDFVATYVQESCDFFQCIEQNRQQSETQVVIGGDHSVAMASILADIKKYGAKNVGVLIFDSHDDFLLLGESLENSTGNLHGMWVRALFTPFDEPEWEELTKEKISLANLMYVGNLDIENTAREFFAKQHVPVLSEKDFLENPQKTRAKLQDFVARFSHLHVSFDFDVLRAQNFDAKNARSSSLGVNLPYENGMDWQLVSQIVDEIKLTPTQTLSLDLVELNATREGFLSTKKYGAKILKSWLSK
jgi:arginase family enzyme